MAQAHGLWIERFYCGHPVQQRWQIGDIVLANLAEKYAQLCFVRLALEGIFIPQVTKQDNELHWHSLLLIW